VASAVGRISVRIFGEATPQGRDVAYHLGRALQLTNILRDIDEDAARERIYLPREALEEAGIRCDEILAALNHPAFDHACRAVARKAAQHFDEAANAMEQCNRKAIKPAHMMRDYYANLLHTMLMVGWHAPRTRVSLGKLDKLVLLFKLLLP
jgi:phytoene synthase